MIVLDTNIVSELMKAAPDERVVKWIAAQPGASLFTTSITQAEILHGIMLLPSGKIQHQAAIQFVHRNLVRNHFFGFRHSFANCVAHELECGLHLFGF